MGYDLGALVDSTRTVTIHAAVPRGRDPRNEFETGRAMVLRPILAKDRSRANAFQGLTAALQHVRHSGLFPVEDLLEVEGRPAAVGALAPGAPLSRLLAVPALRSRPFELPAAARLVLDAARAVQVLHAARADLRPLGYVSSDSIWATTEGRAILLPTARTAPLKPSLSLGSGGGWTRYRAPETELEPAPGLADERADVYSLAILLWELLAAGHPRASRAGFDATSECPTWVDPRIMKLVMRSVSSDVTMRPRDPGTFADELEASLSEGVVDGAEDDLTIELEGLRTLEMPGATVESPGERAPFAVAEPPVRSVRSLVVRDETAALAVSAEPPVPRRPVPPRPSGAPRLRIVGSGTSVAPQLLLRGGNARWVVGRATFVDLVVPDPDMSREHFEVLRVGESGFRVHDLGSKNGLFVNGRAAQNCLLVPGDEVFAGATRLRFEA